MAIDVVWEQMRWSDDPLEPGETQVLAVVRDEHSLVERFLVDFRTADLPYLRFVSHETVTILHQEQIPQLAKELEALHDQDHHPDVAKHLNAVLDLVRNAYGSKHTLIAFRAS